MSTSAKLKDGGTTTTTTIPSSSSADPVIIIGAGLAGLVAAHELAKRQVRSLILDQENAQSVGGQAFWSLGGLFLVDSAAQRRFRVRDSRGLALRDWASSARFDRPRHDRWPRRWARAYVEFAAKGIDGGLEGYVADLGLRFMPQVHWPERGQGRGADGHGNSVPRFHLTWGTGPEVVRVFEEPVRRAEREGLVEMRFRHRVDGILVDDETGRAVGVKGTILEPDDSPRGVKSSRKAVGEFEIRGAAVLVASGGIGGNLDAVRANWPTDRLGSKIPRHFIVGVPAHVDGRMIDISKEAGASVINMDRMWHYTEGIKNWNPIWPDHGIRILSSPSPLWLDATGKRLPPFLYPGTDTLGTLEYICKTGYDYTWFILDHTIIIKEFVLSGSEQNVDLTGKSVWNLLRRILGGKGPVSVQDFREHGEDFIIRDNLEDLVAGMNDLVARDKDKDKDEDEEEDADDGRSGEPPVVVLDPAQVRDVVEARDDQMAGNGYSKDAQAMLVRNARSYLPERVIRVATPHRLLDPRHGPLVAVRLHLLTRKTLGGVETDLRSNVCRPDGARFPGLYAAGEAAGFGGGGVHGYNALEGTFLGGCIFSGRAAGLAMADEVLGVPLPPEGEDPDDGTEGLVERRSRL